MSLKATIFKIQIQLADIDRHIYQDVGVTIARHPSENDKRMMCRIIAYAFHFHEQLAFTKGLCVDDEPDLWQLSLSDDIELWIDLGLVEEKRIRKACGRSSQVVIYSYGEGGAELWWQKIKGKVQRLENLSVFHIPAQTLDELAAMVQRTMTLQVTIEQGEAWVTDGSISVNVAPTRLK